MNDAVEHVASRPANTPMSPVLLSKYLGQKHQPTPQQAAVIGAQPGPMLVVAGAGAGKTETMAARVVWLVANGFVRPEQVLGLTFTRKAAQEMGTRIRERLGALAANEDLVRRLDPSGELEKRLEVIAPTVSTYDAYAGALIREYGLLVPVEPDARLITDAELHAIASDVVFNYTGGLLSDFGSNPSFGTVVEELLALTTSMGNELATAEWVGQHARDFLAETEAYPKGPRARVEFTQVLQKWRSKQEERAKYLPLIEQLNEELRRRGVVTFNEQMSVAAGLARDHPEVGRSQRARYRVVMLDEYQDTSHAQRVLLRSLFGGGVDPALTVTAVGDPMQAIYGWRGATAANLEAFVHDFPLGAEVPAPKQQLTTSWRNPPEVLELANGVSDAVLGRDEDRAVAPLSARPGSAGGQVQLGFFHDQDTEINYVADTLAEEYDERARTGERFKAAVLVRKNKHAGPIAAALDARGVPHEIVGLAGLLDVPEVADAVAIATMLVRPDDSAAALRILGGPAVGLGLYDLEALASRAANLRGNANRDGEAPTSPDAEQHLIRQLDQLRARADIVMARADRPEGLADAVADLGEPERYSPEGYARLSDLAAKLRWLRTHSLGKRLSDLFADIISIFGIRTEVLARRSGVGAVHLDRLMEVVSAYPGNDLEALLNYFALARTHEDGLTPGSVIAKNDRVQILTAHKAKGLEWDTVAVVHADADTYKAQTETFLTYIRHLPTETFADPDVYAEFAEVENRTDFEKAAKAWLKDVGGDLAEESARLFYVAVTRSGSRLLVTGSRTRPDSTKDAEPYEHFLRMRQGVDPSVIVAWDEPAEDDPDAAAEYAVTDPAAPESGHWPHFLPAERDLEGARRVEAALAQRPAYAEGELFSLWERDTTALIEEHEAAKTGDVAVVMPRELTASDVVALKADPAQFARRARRPVPFKPNTYAKRGTAFHEWLEEFYGARPLLSEDELPGNDEHELDGGTLERLKRSFEESVWAQRTPSFVEYPFELALGEQVVRGRMDAVFEDPNPGSGEPGWVVVDWKTGEKPARDAMESAKLQLAIYREAWRRIAGDGRPVRALFFYVRTGESYAPRDLPDAAALEALLAASATREEG